MHRLLLFYILKIKNIDPFFKNTVVHTYKNVFNSFLYIITDANYYF